MHRHAIEDGGIMRMTQFEFSHALKAFARLFDRDRIEKQKERSELLCSDSTPIAPSCELSISGTRDDSHNWRVRIYRDAPMPKPR